MTFADMKQLITQLKKGLNNMTIKITTPNPALEEIRTIELPAGEYKINGEVRTVHHSFIVCTALQAAPEVVTVEEYLHGYLETVNKIGIDKNCAAYKFLMETNSRHTKYMQEKYPHGLIIKRTE